MHAAAVEDHGECCTSHGNAFYIREATTKTGFKQHLYYVAVTVKGEHKCS
jgi:hypothetical protein